MTTGINGNASVAAPAQSRPAIPSDAWQADPSDESPTTNGPMTQTAQDQRAPVLRLSAGERLGFVYSSLGFFVVLSVLALGATLAFGAGFGAWILTTLGMALLLVVVNLILNVDMVIGRR